MKNSDVLVSNSPAVCTSTHASVQIKHIHRIYGRYTCTIVLYNYHKQTIFGKLSRFSIRCNVSNFKMYQRLNGHFHYKVDNIHAHSIY